MREILLQPAQGFFFGGERAVGLGLVGGLGYFADVFAGAIVKIRQYVTSEDERRLRRDGHSFGSCGIADACGWGREAGS